MINNPKDGELSMKKRFASYLCMGKAASLPLLMNPGASLAEGLTVQELLTPDLHILQQPGHGITLMSDADQAAVQDPYGGSDRLAAQVVFPPEGCADTPPGSMNFILTGIRPGEEAFLMVGTGGNAGAYWDDLGFSGLRIPFDSMRVISAFQFGSQRADLPPDAGGQPDSAIGTISIPVDLHQLGIQDNTLYFQAVSGVANRVGLWDDMRFSEVDEIQGVTGDCVAAPVTDPYGGGDSY
ncbi:MAG: hypothetical protein GY862_20120 [Gammaproteobacteria bacterium]|nr:hypothetical protein [Gammaproteobacteria bacterium]